ncbi:hypothetical protein BH10ACI1_BH10ACI1_04160 [soil metagenome]
MYLSRIKISSLIVLLSVLMFFVTIVSIFGQFGRTNNRNNNQQNNNQPILEVYMPPNAANSDWLTISHSNDEVYLGSRNGYLKSFNVSEGIRNLFELKKIDLNTPLRQVTFSPSDVGYFVGGNNIYNFQKNRGWISIFNRPSSNILTPELWSIDFADKSNACVVGVNFKTVNKRQIVESGLLLCNYDLDKTPTKWNEAIKLPDSVKNKKIPLQLTAIDFVDKNGWLVGDEGLIWQTKDAGKTWEAHESITENPLMSVAVLDEDNAWAVGFNSTILQWSKKETEFSTNNSNTKNEENSQNTNKTESKITEVITSIGNTSSTIGATISGSTSSTANTNETNQTVKTTETLPDNKSWHNYESNPLDNENLKVTLRAVKFADNKKDGWIIGNGGTILYTDNGKDWQKLLFTYLPKEQQALLKTVDFYSMTVDEKYCWIAGSKGTILRIKYKN